MCCVVLCDIIILVICLFPCLFTFNGEGEEEEEKKGARIGNEE